MISPTIGRVVWYYPSGESQRSSGAQPHAALVAFVHSDRLVNLAAHDHNGVPYSATSVRLLQDDDAPGEGPFATWMPYQVGQAKKHEGEAPSAA